MPFISEAASAIKSRFGFHDPPDSVRATPDLIAKSASRENLSQFSAIRSYNDRYDNNHDANSNSTLVVRSFDLPEDPSFWKDHNVQVIIRLRPLSSSEISLHGYNRCVKQESHQTLTWTGHPESRFTFDLVADETVSQEKLFKVAGVPMVENCVGGYNSCMFAYGQTGSGKTHTMLGDIEGGTRRHSVNCGMTPRVFEYLFSRIQKEKEVRREEKLQFTCKCSFLEIYNEQILDLLNPSSSNLQMREDSKKGVYVENLKELEVTTATEVMQQLLEGATNRKVAATNMNRASSRSHSVFTCAIESTWESQGVTHHRFARLNLVDLAGSERQKSSGAEGERLKEATNINKSLSTLGLVIMNLVSVSNGKSLHVPYRDSKLTFLLQDSLGGNSKTIIIANISPSNCCSLETLSTLKFAQRAKFIKNNAIVNEDASGDVLAMRMQIQQLKKEVSRLQSLVSGGAEDPDHDSLSVGFLGTPRAFKWEGVRGCLTPLTSDKRMSQKEYEVVLVGALKREQDNDLALQALTAENQAAMRLAKQREDEIQGLKMRLRFREAGIKRLEAVASGKVSAESYLLKEKEEHLKEIEVLRSQVDRNQEVTRFAMENIRLTEEIRRLKSFCEEGEKERMNEQIAALQNKLLEALDWKLMHESEASTVQKASPTLVNDIASDLSTLTPIKEQGSPWLSSSVNEENEFLRVQAIQNQAEINSLRKKLDHCMEEKQKLERHITELEDIRYSKAIKEDTQKAETSLPSARIDDMQNMPFNDQMELKAIVDGIAAASQREAEAHEIAITLSKENDELKTKLKVLIEDNNKLIDLYERAAAEKNIKIYDEDSEDVKAEGENTSSTTADEKSLALKKIEDMEHQLSEMHEENEKLMGLYEKAMQEKDEIKRMLSSGRNHNVEVETGCPEKLVEVDAGRCSKQDELIINSDANPALFKPTSCDKGEVLKDCDDYSSNMQEESSQYMQGSEVPNGLDSDGSGSYTEANISMVDMQNPGGEGTDTEIKAKDELIINSDANAALFKPTSCDKGEVLKDCDDYSLNMQEESSQYMQGSEVPNGLDSDESGSYTEANISMVDMQNPGVEGTDTEIKAKDELSAARIVLDKAQEKLSISASSIRKLGLLECAVLEVDELSRETEALKDIVQIKQIEYKSLKHLLLETHERKAILDKKFSALKCSLSSICSSMAYFEQRKARARARVDTSTSDLELKKGKLSTLQIHKCEVDSALSSILEAEVEAGKNLTILEVRLEEEIRRKESKKVLIAIDNVEKTQLSVEHSRWKLGGKATELLKSEEEMPKLQKEIKSSQEKLGDLKRKRNDLNGKSTKLEAEILSATLEVQKALNNVEERKLALQDVNHEIEILLELRENGMADIDDIIVDFHQLVFDIDLKEGEMKLLEEEIKTLSTKSVFLHTEKVAVMKALTELVGARGCQPWFSSEMLEQELEDVKISILQAKSQLEH